ncbi:MAG: hypothetical protein R6X34_22440 [Chloroflexota bacterium]
MNNHSRVTEEKAIKPLPSSRLMAAVVLGAAVGVFTGILAMAVAMLVLGIFKLALPDARLVIAGLSVTAVVFVVFCALGWASASIYIWRKLPAFPTGT